MNGLEEQRYTTNTVKALLISGEDVKFMSFVSVGVEFRNY